MQEILYYESPYLVTAYSSISEAFRSDRWACFQPQPDPGGILLFQYGIHNYLHARPADEAGDCGGVESAFGASETSGEDAAGVSTGVLVGGGVALALLAGGAGLWMARRRSTAADRE